MFTCLDSSDEDITEDPQAEIISVPEPVEMPDPDFTPETKITEDDELEVDQLEAIPDTEPMDSEGEQTSAQHTGNINSPNTSNRQNIDWSTSLPSLPGRQPVHNIIRFQEGIKRGIHPESEAESFLLFFDPVLQNLLIYSNLQGRRVAAQSNFKNPNIKRHWRPIDKTEMKAFIAILVLSGAYGDNYQSTIDMWSFRDGRPICRALMSRERFIEIKKVIRLDDPLQRNKQDPLAPVRDTMTLFNEKLLEYYIPGPYLTIDEQLVEFHGRVKFKQYIPSKPGKFGIKLFWMCDSNNW